MATIKQTVDAVNKLLNSEGKISIDIPWPSKRRMAANIIERGYPNIGWTPLKGDPDGIKYVEVATMVDGALQGEYSWMNILIQMGKANCQMALSKVEELIKAIPEMVADLTKAIAGSVIPSTPPAPNIAGMASASTNKRTILQVIGQAFVALGNLLWNLIYCGLNEIPDPIIELIDGLTAAKKTVEVLSIPIPA